MARIGVTQTQVDGAADALLKAGERPTIERVRAVLGTGSPNTLIRLLDDWWARLGERLQTQQMKLRLPDAPPAAVEAANALWLAALEHATAWSTSQLQAERDAMRRECAAMTQRAAEAEQAAALAVQREAEALARADAADRRAADLERVIGEQQERLTELRAQVDLSSARVADAERACAASAIELRTREREWTQTLAEATEYTRVIENRAHAEVDRAREELKAERLRIAHLEKEAVGAKQRAAQQNEAALAGQRAAEREVVRLGARLQALEEQIARPVREKVQAAAKAKSRVTRQPRTGRSRKSKTIP